MHKINQIEFEILKVWPLGERLRFFRSKMQELYGKRNYSTKALGERLNVSPQSITAIERGISKNPSYHVMQKISIEFNIPLEAFSDEYYENGFRELSIGSTGSKENAIINNSFIEEDYNEAYLGCILFKVYHDNNMRIIYSKTTENAFEILDFAKPLSRFVHEMELLDQDIKSFESKKTSPIEFSYELLRLIESKPDKYPLIKKEKLEEAIKGLNDLKGKDGER
ncbi:helix-turn-helix domain-containing protein [Gracilibacillus xinjiangensis]|uniref:Helix-turn-helix domain-containing protein n=1 Tax=Gracilibacillus xinjiangensis TaxID=1193282 RepID=A0ABV8WS08_9BACI